MDVFRTHVESGWWNLARVTETLLRTTATPIRGLPNTSPLRVVDVIDVAMRAGATGGAFAGVLLTTLVSRVKSTEVPQTAGPAEMKGSHARLSLRNRYLKRKGSSIVLPCLSSKPRVNVFSGSEYAK